MQIRLPLLCGSIACFNVARSLNKWEQLCTNHKWPCSFTLMNFLHENELFQRGWGVFVTLVEIPWGLGGGGRSSVPYKNGKSTVVLSEIPSVVGVWIFSGTTISRTMIQLIQKRGFPWHRFKVCLLKFDLIAKKVSK